MFVLLIKNIIQLFILLLFLSYCILYAVTKFMIVCRCYCTDFVSFPSTATTLSFVSDSSNLWFINPKLLHFISLFCYDCFELLCQILV